MASFRTGRGRDGRLSRLAIVLAYACISIAWIAFSDALLDALVTEPRLNATLATGKGIAFVVVTASLGWVLLLLRDRRLDRGRRALEASEERYRMLAERSQDVVYRMRLQPEPAFEYVSPAIEALTGRTPAEVCGDPEVARSLVHPDDRELVARMALADDEPVLVRWLLDDGRVRWTEHRLTRIRDASGAVVAIEGSARDVTDRVLADRDRAVLLSAIDRSPVGVALTTGPEAGYALSYVNPAMAALAGLPPEQLLGRSSLGFVDGGGPLDAERAGRLARGEPVEIRTSLPDPGGEARPVRFLVSPLIGADGSLEALLTFLQDQSEAAARSRAESMLRAALDASPLAVVTMDLEGIVTGWNAAAERLFGWPAGEAVGRLLPYLDEAGWDGTAERRRQLLDGTAEASIVRPFRRADGSPLMGHLSTGVIRDPEGNATGYVSLVSDLTDSLRRDELNSQLRRAIDHAAEAIVITDLAGTITYVNPAFTAITGYPADDVLGRNPRVLKSGRVPASVYDELWRRLTAGESWRGVLVNRRKDGTLYEEEATLSAVLGNDGRPTAYVGVKRDLTLEKRLAAGLTTELMDRAAVQDAMSRIVVHETAGTTAQAVCDALAGFGDVEEVDLLVLPPDGPSAVPLAWAGKHAPGEPGRAIVGDEAAAFRERAAGEAWADIHGAASTDGRVLDPAAPGVVRVNAPIRHGGRTVAVLRAAAHTTSPDAWVARYLKISSELATHAGPVLGPQLQAGDPGDRTTGARPASRARPGARVRPLRAHEPSQEPDGTAATA